MRHASIAAAEESNELAMNCIDRPRRRCLDAPSVIGSQKWERIITTKDTKITKFGDWFIGTLRHLVGETVLTANSEETYLEGI
jgi:hypothetical protein